MMTQRAEDATAPASAESEDVIGSSPGRLDTLLTRRNLALPESFGRRTVLSLGVVAALIGLVIGYVTAPAEPEVVATAPTSTAPADDPGLRPQLLTLQDLAAVGEQASGGTYTVGSASALPDPCSRPAPGDAGVRYVPGALQATGVSFQLVGGSVTERVTRLLDDVAARDQLRALVSRVHNCPVDANVNVELATIGPDVGDEYVQAMVTHSYPSGGSITVAILLVRVDRWLLEFSLTGPSSAAAESGARCLAIARAGLSQ